MVVVFCVAAPAMPLLVESLPGVEAADDEALVSWLGGMILRATLGSMKNLFFSYLVIMKSLILCSSLVSGKGVSLGSYSPNHTALQYWLPLDFIRSISSWVKLAMEIDLTRWGGLRPRRRPEQEVQTKEPTVMLM